MSVCGHSSTFVDPDGTILDVRDDGDKAIYLVHSPDNWDGSKNDLLTIGYTPEPATLKDYNGQNINSQKILKFWFSERHRLGQDNLFMSWTALKHLDKLAELKRNKDLYIKILKEYKELLKEIMLNNVQLQKNNAILGAGNNRNSKTALLAAKRIALRTSLALIPNVSIPGEFIDATIPFDTTVLDAQLENAIQDINKKYDKIFKDIISK
jgi:hypothetical protein